MTGRRPRGWLLGLTGRQLGAEFVGTAGLLLAVVGSGIATSGGGLAPGGGVAPGGEAASAQLFRHAVVVGAALGTLIATFGSVSGAHFNPAVTLVDALFGGMRARRATGYVAAQLAGGAAGVVLANALFGLPPVALGDTDRTGIALAASEAVATFGLVVVIFGVIRAGRAGAVPAAVGAWIGAAIYFTSSTSFANPAVTVSRMLTDTFTGITPVSVPGFLAGQLAGALAAAAVIAWLFRPDPDLAHDVAVPHATDEEGSP